MSRIVLKNLNIIEILETINKKYGELPAVQIKTKDGSFRRLSYVELGRKTIDVSSTLIKLGIAKADRVAILSENRPESSVAAFGIISCAGIIVPLDIKLSEKEIQFILNDSQTKCIFVTEKYLRVIDSLKSVLPYLKHVIMLDENNRKDAIQLKDLKLKEGQQKNRFLSPGDTALIVYTSGTTGVAKGVELTCGNLLFQVLALNKIIPYKVQDQFLSILPLNHMLEITAGLIAPLYEGACITYCDSLKTSNLISLMKETNTTAMICVPLVLKMLHDGIMRKVGKLSAVQQKLFHLSLANSKFLLRFNIRIGKLLFKSLHNEFGGKLRLFVSGGAPLSIEVEENLNALGFRILQGYGLTETAPVISVNTCRDNKLGSVGKPLPGIEIKILKDSETASEGEIITRGPHVMKGYFKNPEKTAEVLKDGWLHTGDIGYLDKDGFLHISGRIRNLIVLGAGKKVFPEEVEEVVGKSPYIREICVLGKSATKGLRKGCEEVYAVIVPNLDLFEQNERQEEKTIKDKIQSEITRLSGNLADYKKIMDFQIQYDELPKTATKKIIRKVIADLINKY